MESSGQKLKAAMIVQILAEVHRILGVPGGSWHTQKVSILSIESSSEGWMAKVKFIEDLDVFAQYGQEITWSGDILFTKEKEQPLLYKGRLVVTEADISVQSFWGKELVVGEHSI